MTEKLTLKALSSVMHSESYPTFMVTSSMYFKGIWNIIWFKNLNVFLCLWHLSRSPWGLWQLRRMRFKNLTTTVWWVSRNPFQFVVLTITPCNAFPHWKLWGVWANYSRLLTFLKLAGETRVYNLMVFVYLSQQDLDKDLPTFTETK